MSINFSGTEPSAILKLDGRDKCPVGLTYGQGTNPKVCTAIYPGVEKIIEEIRNLTPNRPEISINKNQTYTHKQWTYNMKFERTKENLRKKSTRLQTREDNYLDSFDQLDKLLEQDTIKSYQKKWEKLSKRDKINRIMIYYGKSMDEIVKVYDKLINEGQIIYDKKCGKIENIIVNNIFDIS